MRARAGYLSGSGRRAEPADVAREAAGGSQQFAAPVALELEPVGVDVDARLLPLHIGLSTVLLVTVLLGKAFDQNVDLGAVVKGIVVDFRRGSSPDTWKELCPCLLCPA